MCQYSNCTAGSAGPVGGTCAPCRAGKYSPTSRATACTNCEAGKYVYSGSAFCISCPTGKTSVPGSVSQMDCNLNSFRLGAPSSNQTVVPLAIVATCVAVNTQALYSCTSSEQCKYQGCDGYCDPSLRCWTWATNGSKWCQDQPPGLLAGTYSGDGKNGGGDKACATHVVRLSLSLSLFGWMYMAESNHTLWAKFMESIARAAGASPADVGSCSHASFNCWFDSSTSRMMTIDNNEGIFYRDFRIDVSVNAKDKAAADAIGARLTYNNINAELLKSGIYNHGSYNAQVVVRPFTQSLSAAPFPIGPIIGGAVGGVVLIGMTIAYWWCWRQRNTSGQQSAVPGPSVSALLTVQEPVMRHRRPPSALPPTAPWSPPPTPPPAPSVPSLSATVPLPFAATTNARAAPFTRPQSQPHVVMGDVYDPSLSEMRAWQHQPVVQEETPCETGCFQEEETVRDRMPSGPPLHPPPPFSPPPPQPPEAPRKRECVVCYDKEPTMAMIPCGHVCSCFDCAELLRECPMCRAPVLEARRIYLL